MTADASGQRTEPTRRRTNQPCLRLSVRGLDENRHREVVTHFLLPHEPAGFRFYHTHNRAGGDLKSGRYGGEGSPIYIESKHEPGNYDREVFLTLKERWGRR
jgi:hypothetical protein